MASAHEVELELAIGGMFRTDANMTRARILEEVALGAFTIILRQWPPSLQI